MKYALVLLSSLTMCAHKPVNQLRSPVVRLVNEESTFCTGSVISDTLVLTAAHCVLMQDSAFAPPYPRTGITLRSSNNVNTDTVATVYKVFPQADQALLTGDFKGFQHAIMIKDLPMLIQYAKPGQDLEACGFPYGGHLLCNKLKFVSPKVFFWGAKGILIPGMSGGPVFIRDLIHGDILVAINTAMDDDLAIVSPLYGLDEMK